MNAVHVGLASFLVLMVVVRIIVCERDSILYCGGCIALIEEINWQTGITDPKKKLQIGSFQLDASGNMKAREVPLAQSEAHLIEVMEVICRYMYYYVKYIDRNGQTNYIRDASRDGSAISKKHTEETKDIKHSLQFACDYVLEHYDDDLLAMYQAKDEEIAEKLCVDMAGLCTRQNVTDQMWAYASAIMLGMTEKAAENGDPKAQAMIDGMNGVGEDETDEDEMAEILAEPDSDDVIGSVDDVTGQRANESQSSHIEL